MSRRQVCREVPHVADKVGARRPDGTLTTTCALHMRTCISDARHMLFSRVCPAAVGFVQPAWMAHVRLVPMKASLLVAFPTTEWTLGVSHTAHELRASISDDTVPSHTISVHSSMPTLIARQPNLTGCRCTETTYEDKWRDDIRLCLREILVSPQYCHQWTAGDRLHVSDGRSVVCRAIADDTSAPANHCILSATRSDPQHRPSLVRTCRNVVNFG